MAIEIERKFLVISDDYKNAATKVTFVKQAYLSSNPSHTVRIRIYGKRAFITIKGKSNANGTSRFEWEKEIDLKEADELFLLCEEGFIAKKRYEVPNGEFTFEVDEFMDENEGLVIAEIELKSENDSFELPEWIGTEVTGDNRYYNSALSKQPFTKW